MILLKIPALALLRLLDVLKSTCFARLHNTCGFLHKISTIDAKTYKIILN
jgi:hypothetical protein